MNQTITILKKELKDYFLSPVGYIVISIFLIISGWLFFSNFFLYKQADVRIFFSFLPIVFAFVIPATTMRLFSEELNIGSYEIIHTMPVTLTNIILGKFLATVVFICAMLLPTLLYAITVSFLGEIDWGIVFAGYLGAILLGSCFAAIGIFTSSITKNQIVACIVGMSICFTLTIVDSNNALLFVPNSFVNFFQFLAADYHFNNIAKGILDTRDILYFLSVCFVGLYGTHLSLSEKN
ncbi:MAG: ABC transporter permease subunit [Desulfobacterales bacterium]|nr:ABC transporter permease subunit [Desulfobacterales bacterium]MCP4163602.1 ABC transporter permease subunit [Deltaproteobacteria bacterium]